MESLEKFVSTTGLIGEPVRAKMLWLLLDGKAYTATELADFADVSITSASNHLAKLLNARILSVEMIGRYRYYTFARPEIAYAIEAMAQLIEEHIGQSEKTNTKPMGIKYCRTCYDHLAGYVGVKMTQTMIKKSWLIEQEKIFIVTDKGWTSMAQWDIHPAQFLASKRPLTRTCLDWSERKFHLAGQLGAVLLHKMIAQHWFRKKMHTRELLVTPKGIKGLHDWLGLSL